MIYNFLLDKNPISREEHFISHNHNCIHILKCIKCVEYNLQSYLSVKCKCFDLCDKDGNRKRGKRSRAWEEEGNLESDRERDDLKNST